MHEAKRMANVRGYVREETQTSIGAVVTFIWHPGDITPAHNHRSPNDHPFQGWVFVLKGSLFQITQDGSISHHTEGTGLIEFGDGFVHTVGNAGNEDAHSVHVYTPGLVMECFAYEPPTIHALAKLGLVIPPTNSPRN